MQPNKTIQYGTEKTTKFIDDNGSTVELEVKYADGKTTGPIRRHYAIRHRTDKTDLQTLELIAAALLNDPFKVDGELKLERTKTGDQEGYYTIIECYTVLEY